jgi:hypothetical protein
MRGGKVVLAGETASHTTPFAWRAPFLKDFSRRHSSPALPFQHLGDHLQLPPTVLSDVAAREGLSETLFQRAHAKWYRENVAVMLTTQYRMHEDIMRRVL